MPAQPIPPGFHTITPYLMADGAGRLIEFLQRAFAAEVKHLTKHDDGLVMHALLQIGDSMVMLSDGRPQHPAQPAAMYLYVPNVDELFQRAVEAGGAAIAEPCDQFYGDRMGGIQDPAGNTWWIATHTEDVSDEELQRRKHAHLAKNS